MRTSFAPALPPPNGSDPVTDPVTDPMAGPGSGALRDAVLLLSLGALLLGSWRAFSRQRGRPAGGRASLPERLQTWEGEGGLPAPQTEPVAEAAARSIREP